MSRFSIGGRWRFVSITLAAALTLLLSAHAGGDVLTLPNGLQIEGKAGKITKIGENPLNPAPSPGPVNNSLIMLVDDDLRRVFVSVYQNPTVTVSEPLGVERIRIEQRVASTGRRIGGVGPTIRTTPWDEWGRRIITLQGPSGPIDIVQGITEVTPTYTRVEGLQGSSPYIWDMRVATSSIPRDALSRLLKQNIDAKNPDDRLRIVRLYIQSDRLEDARAEVEEMIGDFPELAELNRQHQALAQSSAQQKIREIERRRDSGQHPLVLNLLQNFPSEDVAGETLLKVRDMFGEYQELAARIQKVHTLLESHIAAMDDAKLKERIAPIQAEIAAELNFNNIDRMADFLRLADDEALTHDQKIALAVSGWLLGSGSATENAAVALSLVEVRDAAAEYLRATRPHERDALIEKIGSLEGGTPAYLAKIVAHMKPPLDSQGGEVPDVAGMYELTVPGLSGEPDIRYWVQLPPFYDPLRRYPCIVTMNGGAASPLGQIQWWAGPYDPDRETRMGQATRYGYIVLAPQWTKEHQTRYEYSTREHAAVLYSLRDACRRFSIDTDRVFLSGYSAGGDAAWDIGLAHPDLWAGVIPIAATARKYIPRYWENGKNVAMYFVGGEMDGDNIRENSPEFNRYLRRTGFDVTIVNYQGRGHESFPDEILRLFQWMEVHRRGDPPREFACTSMRHTDNFFWCVEVERFPDRSMVPPLEWDARSGVRAAPVEGRVRENNSLYVKTSAEKTVVWFPEGLVDFGRKVSINGRTHDVEPSAKVLLEDVRTRGDRQRPFWARVEP